MWSNVWPGSKLVQLLELGFLICNARMIILTLFTVKSKYRSEWESCFGKHSILQRMVVVKANILVPLSTKEVSCKSFSLDSPSVMQDYAEGCLWHWGRGRELEQEEGFLTQGCRLAKIKQVSRAESQMRSWVQFLFFKERERDSKQDNKSEASKQKGKARNLRARVLTASTCLEEWLPGAHFFFEQFYIEIQFIYHITI